MLHVKEFFKILMLYKYLLFINNTLEPYNMFEVIQLYPLYISSLSKNLMTNKAS
jgi:hypothetical protein